MGSSSSKSEVTSDADHMNRSKTSKMSKFYCFGSPDTENDDTQVSETDELGESNLTISEVSGADNAYSRSYSTRSNSSSRFLSRFGFRKSNLSFKLGRSVSTSSFRRSHPLYSTSLSVPANEQVFHASHPGGFSNNFRDNQTMPTEISRNETGLSDWQVGDPEPMESNFQFSRTLSVGRLRERILRRSSSTVLSRPLQHQMELAPSNIELIQPASSSYAPSIMANSFYNTEDYGVQTRSRAARYHDPLEHRPNFLERRRRIRYQVRALQRLGSRFENFPRHNCVVLDQHRTGVRGHCSCRRVVQDASNSNGDPNSRSSISRIVMLAEALFEVLDEIHQQSEILSPSVSLSGALPAPTEIVESLPLKSYTTVQKQLNDDVAQCYICLVEYEEGDCMRILPCYHEFHTTCIDKWLKEIHRVCPLCRGDICRPDSLPVGE